MFIFQDKFRFDVHSHKFLEQKFAGIRQYHFVDLFHLKQTKYLIRLADTTSGLIANKATRRAHKDLELITTDHKSLD